MSKKVGIITQARMSSTRLPGKILKTSGGKSLLDHHLLRLGWAGIPIIIATTTNQTDDVIAKYSQENGFVCHRGSENHVLSRFYEAASKNHLDVIVRVTSDCPLIDGDLIKQALDRYLKAGTEQTYMSNAVVRTYPRGFDFEIFSMALLEDAYKHAKDSIDIEHVTPYINKNKNGKTQVLHWTDQTDRHDWRLTVDTPEDFELLDLLIAKYELASKKYPEIAAFLDQHKDLQKINAHIEQKKT